MVNESRIIFIIGPGGVGKTTSGKILAKKLGYDFIDLDNEFMLRVGNIAEYCKNPGYREYCRANSRLAQELIKEKTESC